VHLAYQQRGNQQGRHVTEPVISGSLEQNDLGPLNRGAVGEPEQENSGMRDLSPCADLGSCDLLAMLTGGLHAHVAEQHLAPDRVEDIKPGGAARSAARGYRVA
jgi:hypothetical protein